MALAGLVILVIGDSHMAGVGANKGYLLTNLHDELQAEGAVVHSYGMCGAQAADWVNRSTTPCVGEHHEKSPPTFEASKVHGTWNVGELIDRHRPNLVVIELGEAMAAYDSPALPKPWVYNQVRLLTGAVRAKNVACSWVGPIWGPEGPPWNKSAARVRELSQLLSESVAPCGYIDSTKFAQPGQWPTTDGLHLNPAGYQGWAQGITGAIVRQKTQNAAR
jgi:hypothetical protein